MTPLTTVKLVVAALGIIIWGYGVTVNDRTVQFVGLGLVAVAVLLRFAGPRSPGSGGESKPPAS